MENESKLYAEPTCCDAAIDFDDEEAGHYQVEYIVDQRRTVLVRMEFIAPSRDPLANMGLTQSVLLDNCEEVIVIYFIFYSTICGTSVISKVVDCRRPL